MSTPMFEQYQALKAAAPDAILFFRMGDFYEMFFDDAVVAAKILDLTLTSRNRNDPEPIPMAGVPHHAAAGYIQRLTDAGHRVAIAEQVEDPRKAKGLVKREIVRTVTPGVVLDPTSMAQHQPCWIAAVGRGPDRWGLAFLDPTTGDLRLTEVGHEAEVTAELARMEPREALLEPERVGTAVRRALRGVVLSDVVEEAWELGAARAELEDTLGVEDLTSFGVRVEGAGLRAAGALVRYVRDTLGGALRNLHRLRAYQVAGFMVLDEATRRNLELTRTLIGGRRKGSLLHLLDQTSTSIGSRRLRDWLVFPLLSTDAIGRRQAAVSALVEDPVARRDLMQSLRGVADIERINARVGQGTAHARDLAALRRSLAAVPEVMAVVGHLQALGEHLPSDPCQDLHAELDRWLVEDPPISVTEGGMIRREAHAELDELVRLSLEGVSVIAEMEATERERTGISSLKIRRNKVFGYYIEITRAHLHRVPDDYIRKQTLTNCERYVTPALKELEEKVLGADERRKSLEYELLVALRERVASASPRLTALARRLSGLDALGSLAEVAERWRWCRPQVDDSNVLDVVGGRHPVVEASLDDERFVPNDITLDTESRQLVVLTGPNMSGKSTVMRQTALIALLAQIGSFVPAERARIGICDRICTRVGAADDLARGQSTFMVEMSETASILHHATDRSLVLLDEIGRGTSTYDGLAIAWAVAEDLVDRVGCRTLFATHYHELCELAETRHQVVNQSVGVAESGDGIVFLRRLKEGGASRSYGIQCARLAGLPGPVVARARSLLTRFEKHAPRNERQQLSLFGTAGAPAEAEPEPEPARDPLREALVELDPDAMTPRAALDALYGLKRLLVETSSNT